MPLTFDPLRPSDRETLEELVRAYYIDDGHEYDEALHGRALDELCAGNEFALGWIMREDGETAGYVVITLGFSILYGGFDAFIDEIYVTPERRGKGFGTRALHFVEEECLRRGLRRMYLEVTHHNPRARALYERLGYEDHESYLLSKTPAP